MCAQFRVNKFPRVEEQRRIESNNYRIFKEFAGVYPDPGVKGGTCNTLSFCISKMLYWIHRKRIGRIDIDFNCDGISYEETPESVEELSAELDEIKSLLI